MDSPNLTSLWYLPQSQLFVSCGQKVVVVMVKSRKQIERDIAEVNANWLNRPPKDTKPKARKTTEWNRYQAPQPRKNPFET